MLRESDRGDGTTPGCGSVRSISAYDVDAHCQKVLASLSEERGPTYHVKSKKVFAIWF